MLSCANISKNTLKALTEKYHISESTLKTIIHKYWMQNGTEDFFPSEVYINAELGKGQYVESSEAVRELWEKNYKEGKEVKSDDLKATKEEALTYFPASAVEAHETDKGTYVVTVKKPVAKASNSIKTLLDKDSYSSQEIADYKLVTGQASDEAAQEKKQGPTTYTFKDGITVEAPFKLNYQQEAALEAMDEFIKSDKTAMTLSGYAGTGKTSLMEMLAQKMRKQYRHIVFSASTNKAAAVLRDRVKDAGFTAKTLNKVFGITVEVDETKPYDASNLVIKLKDNDLRRGDVVVIDEASMINEENYGILNGIAKEFGLKIIYVGDEAQLAPVKENKISKVFRDSMSDVRRLTLVERTGDNAILKEATAIRNGEGLSGESSFNKEGKGVAFMKPSSKDAIRAVVDKFVPMLKEKPDYFRILAYTNNAVARYNDAVRNKLGYTDNLPRVGEPIVGYSNWGYLLGKGSDAAYRFINSESYTITNVGKTDTVTITLEDGTKVPMQATEVTIADAMGNKNTIKLMDIRHNEANRQNAIILAKAKVDYWSKANRTSGETAAAYRRKANKIDEFLFVNDVITDPTRKDKYGNPVKLQSKVYDFGYAMTAHKSQGSTFTHVLVDDIDIQTARNRSSVDREGMVPQQDIETMPTQDVSPSMVGESTEDFGFEDTLMSSPSMPKTESTNIRQQLEYVAVSRATDTVTVISNNVKKEDSPLNHVRTTDSTPSTTSQPAAIVGENISSKGSAFAKRLTNPFNNETVEFRGTKFDNAEHAYQTWKSGKFDQRGFDAHGGKVRGTTDYSSNYQTMVEILTAKLQQHPDLVEGITERGGEAYLKASTHDVVGDKYWETKTGQNKFIEALTDAYNAVVNQANRPSLKRERSYGEAPIKLPKGVDVSQVVEKLREPLKSLLKEYSDIKYEEEIGHKATSFGANGWVKHDVISTKSILESLNNAGYSNYNLPTLWDLIHYSTSDGSTLDGSISRLYREHPELEEKVAQLIVDNIEGVQVTNQRESTINPEESRFNKEADLIAATIAPYFKTSYEDYVAMTPEKQKEMREAFAKAAHEVAKALGIPLDMKQASFNIGGYEFDDGDSVIEPSFTFRLDTTPENARLFAALMGDLGYEQQEAVVSNYDISDRDSADGIRFSLEFKDSAALLKLINQFDIKNFTYDKTNGVLSVLSFDAADVEKFHKLVQQLKENGYDKESEIFYFKSSYDGRTGRKTLYGKWLKAQEGNSQGAQSELYSLVQEALKRVNYYSGKPSNYKGLVEPDEDTVFVFGSNPKGIHSAGAAATAKAKFGAIQGQGEGMQGNAYALPTKDLDKAKGTRWYKPSKKEEGEVKEWYKTHDYSEVQNHPLNAERTMTPQQIIESIKRLYEVANQNPDKLFKVSHYPFGQLSLNGYLGEEMLAMFKQAGQIPSNVVFNKEWTDHWDEIQSKQQPIQQQSNSNYVVTNEGIRIPMEKGTTIKLPRGLGGTTITIERIYEDPYEGTKFYGTQYDARGNRISDITEVISFYNETKGIQVFDASGKDITHISNQQQAPQTTETVSSDSGVNRVTLPGYEYFNDKYEDTPVDAEWKIPRLQELDGQLSLENTPEEQQAILDEMDRILEATSEDDLYGPLPKGKAEEVQQKIGSIGELNQNINALYEDNLLPSSEILHVAELIMNAVSDDITRLQREPGLAEQWFPSLSTKLDFQTATRKEIIQAVGINRLIEAQKRFFDTSKQDFDDFVKETQADLIYENWDAIVAFGNTVFAMNEGFGLKKNYKDGGYILADGMQLGLDDLNDMADMDALRDEIGDEQEYWQVTQRCIDVLISASESVRMAIHDCYKLDKNGQPVTSWGIKERINPREAVTSILTWTQGAISLDDMVSRLMDKQAKHPWLSQLIDRLRVVEGQENPNADFQSQFFNTMCRSFMSYSVVTVENGKYVAIPVNDHPALSDIMQSITSQFKIKQHPLFLNEGREEINPKLLGSNSTVRSEEPNLHKSLFELTGIVENLKRDAALTPEMLETAKDNLTDALRILGFTPSEEVMDNVLNKDSIITMTKYIKYLVDSLNKAREQQKKDGAIYNPFDYKGKNGISGTLRKLLTPITNAMDEVIPNVVYDDGKLYQAYVTPSYLTLLFEKFHWDGDKFKDFIQKEYGYSEWFKYAGSGDEGWRGGWLRRLATNQTARDIFAHTVELNFNKRRYMKNLTDAEYYMSLFTHYFAENGEGEESMVPAWFRVPIQSNKPSSDFIRFYSYRGDTYKSEIVEGIYEFFLQEVNRIQTVKMRGLSKGQPGFIKSFDENGGRFHFLPFLNDYLHDGKKENRTLLQEKDGQSAAERNEELAKVLQSIESLTELKDDSQLRPLVMEAINNFMEQYAQEQLQTYERTGLLEAAKKIKGIYPKELTKKVDQTEWVRKQLENFIWNDYYAADNILQLTVGDKAAFKDADELQKRLAQLHAPGIRANVQATDYEGKRVSDGKYRTLLLKDFEMVKSNLIDNLTEVLDKEIERASAEQKDAWRAIKEDLVGEDGRFRKINVVDGQGYSSPSSYRKKAFMFGRWSRKAEDIYNRLKEDDFTIDDIKTAFQPLKPFMYSQLHKDMGVPNAPITSMPMPFQAKNSEYLLIMADALMQGHNTKRPNMLRAIYRIMEDSELLNHTKGIDTVQFESAIKVGLQGAIDINQFMETENGEEAAYEYMRKLIYLKDSEGRYTKEYNTKDYVHESSYEGYCLQQEIPAHFQNHTQIHGSQERMIIPSDLVSSINGETVYYEWTDPDGTPRKMTAEEFGKEYEDTIAANIYASIKQLRAELRLDSASQKERNLVLSEILQKEILDSPRYGIDMFLACGLDPKTGEFRIPLGDPIQAKRFEQLLNSIIKSRINKQEIAGGPIVQVTNWGTSKQLHIRFKDKESGELLMTEEEYNKVGWSQYVSYKDYLKQRQGGIAYFEVFAPAWSKELYEKFRDKDGNIDMGAIEILNPDLLKMVSYRIPTEDKYSIAPMKVVGFMPQRAGDAIMLPYELTEIDDSDFDVDKRYTLRKVIDIGTRVEVKEGENATEAEKDYIKHNRKSLTKYLRKAVNLQGKTTAEERAQIEKDAEAIAEVDRRTAKRAHEERLATIDRKNSMIEEAEAKTEFSKDAEKSDAIYDKRVDKLEARYEKALDKEEKRYQIELDKIEARKEEKISEEITKLENQKVREKIDQFLNIDRWNNSSQDDALTRQLRIAYLRYMYPTYEPTKGKIANDNKIIDMTWAVLTNEAIASQLLNPGGFDNLKKSGYMIAAYKNPANTMSWEELDKLSVSALQDLYHSTKDLARVDVQVGYYKQNQAAASLIGIFAVNKIAHAILERDHIQIDVDKFCGEGTSFTIADKKFSGLIDLDPTFDDTGKPVGKTLGSGVSGSADAAKTPALHLMGVNLTTVNTFTTLLRLGMPDADAGLFCSQNIISEVLDEFNRKNLDNYEPLSNIIARRLMEIRKKEGLEENSNINTEELSREELIEGLKATEHPETDYKVLLAWQKLQSLADALRKPTFATRFNSISSAVGPQIVDNLILEHKMEQFSEDEEETGFYSKDGEPVSINTLFENHPVLGAFSEAVDIAKGLFSSMPAGSTGFRQLLTKLPANLVETFYRDKKLLSDLSNFYQSYLLIRKGLIDPSKRKEYIENFPTEFMKKDANGKSIQDKYPDNALIQNIKLISSKKTGRSFLTIRLVGEDETKKDVYRAAWIDLHKKDPALSQKLFEYFFFRAGIGFSPKTGMALVPTFVKERLKATASEGNEITYCDVYRHLPALNRILKDQYNSEMDEGKMVIDQFIRNNWNESKLVPKKGGEGTNYQIDLKEGRLVAYTEEDVADLKGVTYMRTYHEGQTYLWKLLGEERDAENQNQRVYVRIKPLGDNNEYLEMDIQNITKPQSETLMDIEDTEAAELESKSNAEMAGEPTVTPPSATQISDAMSQFADAMVQLWTKNKFNGTKADAITKIRDIKIQGTQKQMGKFIANIYKQMGLDYSIDKAIEEFNKLC